MERILKSTKTDLEASLKKAKNHKLKNLIQIELSILNKFQNCFPNDFWNKSRPCTNFTIIQLFKFPSTQTPTQKLKNEFSNFSSQDIGRVWYHGKLFLKLFNLSYQIQVPFTEFENSKKPGIQSTFESLAATAVA